MRQDVGEDKIVFDCVFFNNLNQGEGGGGEQVQGGLCWSQGPRGTNGQV